MSDHTTDPPLQTLSHDNPPFDKLCSKSDGSDASTAHTHSAIHAALPPPRFVARAIFRSLLGTWRLRRHITSRLPSLPSGVFSGTAAFHPRQPTHEARQCVADPQKDVVHPTWTEEYLYIEHGTFRAAGSGFEFEATRRYVWRYDEARDVVSVWFVRPDDDKRVDYLFHEIDLKVPNDPATQGLRGSAGHLCVEDYYDVGYEFAFGGVNLGRWTVRYGVKGPAKDYTIEGEYLR